MSDRNGKLGEEFLGTPLSSAQAAPFNLAVGDIILGRICQIDNEFVYVSTGFKSEGRIPLKEFKPDDEGKIGYKVDDEVEVMVNRIADEDIYLSHENVRDRRLWEGLIKAHEKKEPVNGKITQQVKGGYRMDIGLQRHAFLPGSHLGITVGDQAEAIGKALRVLIIEIDPDSENIVVSHKDLRNREMSEKADEIFETLQKDTIVDGTVTRLAKFGAFVDIGNIEGLVHVSEIAWSRVAHPSNVLKPGETVKVKILDVDRESRKISLSIKQAGADPWDSAAEKFKADSIIEGKVSKVVKFGLFVHLSDGFEGLLHISEIEQMGSSEKSSFKAGDSIKVKVVSVDQQARRIKLGLAQSLAMNVPSGMKQYLDDGKGSVTLGDMAFGALDDV